jgi:glucose/mannose transport system permease protein
MSATAINPRGRRPSRLTPGRIGLYAFLVICALFFLVPLYVMLVTSLKGMPEIRQGYVVGLPAAPSLVAWVKAWSAACTGLSCNGIRVGLVTGYALSFWRPRGAVLLFGTLIAVAFIPYQVFIYPLVRIFSHLSLNNSLPGIVIIHTIFGLPTMTLIFRNHFTALPEELFKAARVDGAGFWRIFGVIMLPMALPIIAVAVILQVTGIWNDFIFGLVFAGRENLPMTVQLNNIVNSTQGEREYNVEMAATLLTAMLPLAVYFVSGRWFVRGIAVGAVKG